MRLGLTGPHADSGSNRRQGGAWLKWWMGRAEMRGGSLDLRRWWSMGGHRDTRGGGGGAGLLERRGGGTEHLSKVSGDALHSRRGFGGTEAAHRVLRRSK